MERTWLAYALDAQNASEEIEQRLSRVGRHYQQASSAELRRQGHAGSRLGLVVWAEPEPLSRWPVWAEENGLGVGTPYVPTGWDRLVGARQPESAAVPLARTLLADPERVVEMNSPLLLGIHTADSDELSIFKDPFGVARLFEMHFDGGWVWSNRAGALPIFAGVAPTADPRGWALFAGGGWFMGDSSPIEGVRKVPGGMLIKANARSRAPSRSEVADIPRLIGPRRAKVSESAEAAVPQITGLVHSVEASWVKRPVIDLSGGRDSRVGAAAAVRDGVDALFRTGAKYPNEVAVAERLVAAAPRPLEHRIEQQPDPTGTGNLGDRALAVHLIHDGMHPPEAIRRKRFGPVPPPSVPRLPGNGGEIAHGFFYGNQRHFRQVRRQGDRGPLARIVKFCRREHRAAREVAYDVVRDEVQQTLSRGKTYGLEGLPLLDYFYLVDRLPNKVTLGIWTDRFSVFSTPAFVRAAFDVSPKERLKDVLHRQLIARILPQWKDIPFYERSAQERPLLTRPRIWQTTDAQEVDRMLRDDSAWGDVFDVERVREMWREVGEDRAHPHYEQVFERIAWRVYFEEHLARLAKSARGGA